MKRALVLGGGGNVGIAWETAILAGLLDGGVDVREADLVIGTSAGSVVGAHSAHGRDPREALRQLREDPPPPLGGRPEPDIAALTKTFTTWAGFEEMTAAACAEIGALALAAKTMPEADWVASFDRNGWPGWPAKPLLITAVDCENGAFRAFDGDGGVPLERACAASCSVPAMFPPVTIEGRRYTDGGVRSGTSADLAQRIEPDSALIVAPMGVSGRGTGLLFARQIAREKGELEAAGVSVRVVQFDAASKEAGGDNLMDPSRRLDVAAAGEAQGRALAPALHGWWHGR